MSDLPNLDAARAALAATLMPATTSTTYRALGECGHDLGYSTPSADAYNRTRPLWCSDCGDYVQIDDVNPVEIGCAPDTTVDATHLRNALAAVDLLTAQLATAEATGRRKGLEEAAGVCEEWADRFNDSTACLLCADYIRSLVPSGAK